ncbi:hypothetical protein NIES2107_14290 [Nostoc carneum NIES-2107]|nr:hypothetical protein NIES2107_14290 [Nostoc carneum NIES-2107]
MIFTTKTILNFSIKYLPIITTNLAITAFLAVTPLQVKAATLVNSRAALESNDQIDWSSLGKVYNPFNPNPNPADFLPNSFSATSQGGLGMNVNIPNFPGVTPPFVFKTSTIPQGVPTNFADGDFVLFTGLRPGTFPAIGNPGPITINFDKPVFAAGTQITVDDTPEFTAFISAFDQADNLLGSFSIQGTSSLLLDNSASFLGIRSDTANISRLVFSSSVPNRALGINRVSIVAVPEPNPSLAFLLVGVSGTILRLRQRSKGISSPKFTKTDTKDLNF